MAMTRKSTHNPISYELLEPAEKTVFSREIATPGTFLTRTVGLSYPAARAE